MEDRPVNDPNTKRYLAAGGLAGLVNGLFGGGGGMILVPLLIHRCGLEERQAFATSMAVILPLCLFSAGIYWVRGGLELTAALPYLAGGLAGGLLAGRLFRRISAQWLRRGFAILILYSAIKGLL